MVTPASGSACATTVTTPVNQSSSLLYGPGTATVRRFLVRLAALGPVEREAVVERYQGISPTPKWRRAETQLGVVVEQANRLDAQNALAGPLIQLVGSPEAAEETDLSPLGEPALAALLALVVQDVAPHLFDTLYSPFHEIIPLDTIRE